MRRLLSIALLLILGLPLLKPLLVAGESSESRLPACCRRNGAHHCAMPAGAAAGLASGTRLTTVKSRCPVYPRAIGAVHHPEWSFRPAWLLYAEVVSHPAMHRQTEAWARASLEGAKHKRGPPAFRLS